MCYKLWIKRITRAKFWAKKCLHKCSEFPHGGGGELKLSTPLASELASALKQARKEHRTACGGGSKLSKSDGDLRARSDTDLGEVRRSSWYSGPSEVSLDDIDLIMSKESARVPGGPLARCSGEGHLAPELSRPRPHPRARPHACTAHSSTSFDDSMSDRRSLLSIASGIYEEIPDLPDTEPAADGLYCSMGQDAAAGQDAVDGVVGAAPPGAEAEAMPEEPTYESVSECVYATMRRPPPPLPPRLPFGTTKLGESWNSRINTTRAAVSVASGAGVAAGAGPGAGAGVTRHSSLGSLPRCCSVSSSCSSQTEPGSARTLPGKGRQAFSVFRKRLKSDSRIASSPKSDTCKENKHVETKKKKFEFAPTRDIFKSFKVGRKMKNLKITTGTLTKGETKSCEFLDETEHVTANRCSKSVECLEDNNEYLDEFDGDLSIEFNDDAVAALALPQEIVDLILRSREQLNKIRLKQTQAEGDYMPMSPIIPPAPIEHHYIVMSPKTNLA